MASKTDIANLALSVLRSKAVIQNVDTETSEEAQTAAVWWDVARQQVLTDYDFWFARTRQTLTEHADDPPDEWAYRYQVPATCVHPRYVENPLGANQPRVPFEIEQSSGTLSLLTNQEDAVLVFTRDEENTALFPAYFVAALAHLLAFYMAGGLTGKQSIQDRALSGYRFAAEMGAAHEGNVSASATQGAPEAKWISEMWS